MLFDQGELQFEKKRIGACAISLSILFTTLWNKLTSGSFIFKLHCGLFQFCLYALQLQRCVLFLLVFFFFTQLLSLIAFPLGCLVLILCQEFDPLSNRQYYFLCVCVQAENRPYFINCSNINSTDGDDPQSPVPSPQYHRIPFSCYILLDQTPSASLSLQDNEWLVVWALAYYPIPDNRSFLLIQSIFRK